MSWGKSHVLEWPYGIIPRDVMILFPPVHSPRSQSVLRSGSIKTIKMLNTVANFFDPGAELLEWSALVGLIKPVFPGKVLQEVYGRPHNLELLMVKLLCQWRFCSLINWKKNSPVNLTSFGSESKGKKKHRKKPKNDLAKISFTKVYTWCRPSIKT